MEDEIKIAGIIKESIVDGPGIRLAVFTQGCVHNCIGCHNPETHSFSGGYYMKIDEIVNMVKKNPLLDGITLSGGDPFVQPKACANLAKKVKEMGLNVVTYTGYTFEEIIQEMEINNSWKELLYSTDILIDGRFDISKKSLLLKFRGSKNQRIIDVKKSLNEKKIVLADM
ncbi:anaerobic ribonucleoside-triphosphate reductase activating protein [Keratinibaculum paraultunense]|uniref:Anaerobic ribonucleoside-triphosphate reductase-activating protein n=1 Tax=Keratinibaculum paraultunense TaxID=1278232 RepID=A0A4R3KYD8_9FIRM|nr:anaerobic ribonucleoside-triphosphate reductase activating protein [Keratinibaculum paraultunense]QQY80326.1 anaerobic ribonucleoside-triphosphate reductase activating protein [Keratinibaculum paraultunense]TCS90848.1 anaerobic ribonucleoside-triphosphate reductase activating protein [Keratinibaculum paraultunense]